MIGLLAKALTEWEVDMSVTIESTTVLRKPVLSVVLCVALASSADLHQRRGRLFAFQVSE